MHRGYIKLWRKIEDSPLHPLKRHGRDFTGYEAMIDLLMMAHGGDEPRKVMKGNQIIEIKRGQLDKTNRQLSERWRWALGKVNNFLQHLDDDGFISRNVNRWFTVITIQEYDLYNPRDERNVNGTRTERERNVNTIEREVMINNDNKIVVGKNLPTPQKEKKKITNGETDRGKDIPFDNFLDYCKSKNIFPAIGFKKYCLLEYEYKLKVIWWAEVRGCINWLFDNGFKQINAQRLRKRMDNAIRFAKERQVKQSQEYQDKKFTPIPKKIFKQEPLWTPPL